MKDESSQASIDEIMPSLMHSTNLVGIPASLIASTSFNQHPVSLHIAGAMDTAHGLFEALDKVHDPDQCGALFQDYMISVFGDGTSREDTEKKRYRNSYLKLIQDWGMDSNNAQSAVMKGWVESRFGLYPTYHKRPIQNIYDDVWIHYIEDKMHSRYHNNCIYMQLDLLYEFCQWFIHRFQQPAVTFKTLYRGINGLKQQCIAELDSKKQKVIRFNNLTSFTDNADIAGEFGDSVVKVDVPVVKLLFFSRLLPKHALHGEAEYLVIGGDYEAELL